MVRLPTLPRHDERDRNAQHRVDKAAAKSPIFRRGLLSRRSGTARRPATADPTLVTPSRRPRASALATLGLILGVLSAAAVATGVLAAPGVVLGLIGALAAVGGRRAAARRHVSGRYAALLGLLLSLAAVVVGLLALDDAIRWPDTGTNEVDRLADWLARQLPWLG